MNARDYRPHERLTVSNHAYSLKHVNNIASYLAQSNGVLLPHGFPQLSQNTVATWIIEKFGFDPYKIEQAERLVRSNYTSKQKIFRKGRPVGSKNRPATDALDELLNGEAGEATVAAFLAETPASTPASQPSIDATKLAAMLRDYVRKSELEPQINRIGTEVNSHMRNHSEDIKTYCENNFTKLFNKVNSIELMKPTLVSLDRRELPPLELGVQHRHFPELLQMCNARTREDYHLNIWIYGPAGTGKTTAAKHVAKALNLTFYALPALETGFQVLGYMDANGKYTTTLFRQCWEHGGVIILDEVDSYSPSAALALNGALANGHCSFPDGMIPRHKDTIILAGANTTGLGGTIEYVGRMKQDAAFLDRWAPLDWPLDEGLESSLCANAHWLAIVRYCRAQVIAKQIKGTMITPRATLYGESLLAAGLSLGRVIASTLKKGMSDAQWAMIAPSKELMAECAFAMIPVIKVGETKE